jgi:hypothetical protein
MTSSGGVADADRQNLESTGILSRLDDSSPLPLTVGDLRWMLKWHGDFVRQLTLLEVALKKRDRRTRQPRRRKKTRR